MGERWDTAVAAAAEEPPADLRAAVEEELIALWNDLNEALQRVAGRCWPAECDGLVVRIVMLSRLTTATPWPWIPAPLLASGIYQGILATADIAFTPPSSPGSTAWAGAAREVKPAGPPVSSSCWRTCRARRNPPSGARSRRAGWPR